ncbi:[Pyruvate dehydrogenase (acetyl-transferring)] kinase isozyme 2 [Friedmanniomyces endolithicus]|nr:[Pyruvate dehydrogenase (acetyl-transferring)] kinase isozyme 2 [Friedmanniomyces endolithicus]
MFAFIFLWSSAQGFFTPTHALLGTPEALSSRQSYAVPPSIDSFYIPPVGFATVKLGAILRSRPPPTPISLLGGVPLDVAATYQLMFRTTDNNGNPAAAVTTVIIPHNATFTNLLAYEAAIDSSDIDCAPSYTLQRGPNPNTAISQIEFANIQAALDRGWCLTVPDFLGLKAAFAARKLTEQAVLDAIRATLQSKSITQVPSTATVTLWGYSGGGIATGAAAELQHAYASELKIAGVVIGGPSPNIANVMNNINGGIFSGVTDTADFTLQDVISDYFDTDILEVPYISSVLEANNMGKSAPPSSIPLYIFQSVNNELSPVADTDLLVEQYCTGGSNVLYSAQLMDTIEHYSKFPATGVSLRQMVQFGQNVSTGTLFRASQFLSEELPIRLAHRVQELGDLPDGLNEMPSITRVQDWYAQSFEEITSLPKPALTPAIKERLSRPARGNSRQARILSEATHNPSVKPGQYKSQGRSSSSVTERGETGGERRASNNARRYYSAADDNGEWPPELADFNSRFAATLEKIKRRHDSVVTTVAQGILEYKRQRQRMQIDGNTQAFLDRFYMSRIGIRMLIGQHIALTDQRTASDPTYVGIICTKTNVRDLAQEAIENAHFVCEDHYGLFDAPQVRLVCDPAINFMYVPGHLSHMLFETLKNSLRAVVEMHGAEQAAFPVTQVVVSEGREDITLKISDEGGGIPRSSHRTAREQPRVERGTTTQVECSGDKARNACCRACRR